MSSQLRLTWQANADAWQQAAQADAEHDQMRAANAQSLANALTAQTSRLEAANARYEEWSARTASTREVAGNAKAELQRRGQEPSAGGAPGPQSAAAWWREFQADADAMDRAIEREHQAAVHDGQPWPPRPGMGSLARGTRCRCTWTRTATRGHSARGPPVPNGPRSRGLQAGNLRSRSCRTCPR